MNEIYRVCATRKKASVSAFLTDRTNYVYTHLMMAIAYSCQLQMLSWSQLWPVFHYTFILDLMHGILTTIKYSITNDKNRFCRI